MKVPFFSVIIPTYNRAHMIVAAVNSVCSQTFKNWELIIVDDGSTDNTKEAIQSVLGENVKYIFQNNMERSAARNTGISHARGKYICFLDSDDYYLDNHLEVLYSSILLNGEIEGMFYTGSITKSSLEEIKHPLYQNTSEHPARFAFRSFLLMNSVCVHRSILIENRFLEDMNVWEDMHLWLRILIKHPFIQIPFYTTVCVNHDERGGAQFFSDGKLPQLKAYLRNVRHLFKTTRISEFISRRELDDFLEKKYVRMAYVGAWRRKPDMFIYCVFHLLKLKPGLFLSRAGVNLSKEFIAGIIRKRGNS